MSEIINRSSAIPQMESSTLEKSAPLDTLLICKIIWGYKRFVASMVVIFSLLGVLFALYKPNVYKSEAALISNVKEQSANGLKGMSGSLSGFASLAGVDLGGGGIDKTTYALEVLKTRQFIYRFIEKYNLKAKLFATNGWNKLDNSLIYDSDIYDNEKNVWTHIGPLDVIGEPSLQEVYTHFMKHNFSVTKNEKTSVIRLSISHYSPFLAKFLVDKLVLELNDVIKKQDMLEAEDAIKYLNKELQNTKNNDLKSRFYSLIEQHHHTLMLTKVRSEYAFKVIDKAIAPSRKSSPQRGLIVVAFTLFGFLLSIIGTLVRVRLQL